MMPRAAAVSLLAPAPVLRTGAILQRRAKAAFVTAVILMMMVVVQVLEVVVVSGGTLLVRVFRQRHDILPVPQLWLYTRLATYGEWRVGRNLLPPQGAGLLR
jgi:hypothetical protein